MTRKRIVVRRYGVIVGLFDGPYDVEVEDLTPMVQVTFNGWGNGYRYTYADPSGQLEVGDIVIAPTTKSRIPQLATVVELGRGSWQGDVPEITTRLKREELV